MNREYWHNLKIALNNSPTYKTAQRTAYVKEWLEKNNIPYKLCNEKIGHFNLYYKDHFVMSFWAYTGKIQFEEEIRGFRNCIKIYNKRVRNKEYVKKKKVRTSRNNKKK